MTFNFATENAYTWNGALSLSTPDISGKASGRLGLLFKTVRDLNIPRLYEYLRKAANENLTDTFLLGFHIRDCRGGKGERNLGRRALVWLFINYPDEFDCVAQLLAEYGRWDDLMTLWPKVLDLSNIQLVRLNYCSNIEGESELECLRKRQNSFVDIMAKQLVNDHAKMEEGNPVSLCAKWAPTEKDSLDRKYKVVNTLCSAMKITPKCYRTKYTTPMRQYLNVVERYMCENRWDNIEYSKVPSCAMKRLKKSFEKHSPKIFTAWKEKLQKGKVTVNAKQLYPHELVNEIRSKGTSDIVCEAQWKILENDVKKLGCLKDSVFICDVSSSMESCLNGNAINDHSVSHMDVAIALSLIGSNAVDGPFHNNIITFHEFPTFHVVSDGSLYERWNELRNADWGCSTNIQASFDLILEQACKYKLSQEDMPKRLFIISDMQFNVCSTDHTNYQEIELKYSKFGYKRPQIIFWNVCGSSIDFPVSVNNDGTALISGYSPSVMKAVLNGTDFSPYTVLRETLDTERLKPVRDALSILDL